MKNKKNYFIKWAFCLLLAGLLSFCLSDSFTGIQIPDAPLLPASPTERKCLVFLVSAHLFTRDGMFFKQSQ